MSVIIYLVVIDYQDKAYYKNDQFTYFASTELKDFQPYNPKFSTQKNFQSLNLDYENEANKLSIIFPKQTGTIHEKEANTQNYISVDNTFINITNRAISSPGIDNTGSLMTISTNKSTNSSNNQSSQFSTNIYKSEMLHAKLVWEEGLFELNSNVGLPDPGGDEDILFIPIPDGFWLLLFCISLYTFWHFFTWTFRIRKLNNNSLL